MLGKGLWKIIGHEPSKQKTEECSSPRTNFCMEDQHSNRSANNDFLCAPTEKSSSRKSSRLLNPSVIQSPPQNGPSREEKDFKLFLDAFREMNEAEHSTILREECSQRQHFSRDVKDRQQPSSSTFAKDSRSFEATSILVRLRHCLLEDLKSLKQESQSIRKKLQQERSVFKAGIHQLSALWEKLYNRGSQNLPRQQKTEKEALISKADQRPEHSQAQNELQLHRKQFLIQEVRHLQMEKARLTDEVSQLTQEVQTVTANKKALQEHTSPLLESKYAELLQQSEKLYERIIHQHRQTIKFLKEDVRLKVEELKEAQKRIQQFDSHPEPRSSQGWHLKQENEELRKEIKELAAQLANSKDAAEDQKGAMWELSEENRHLRLELQNRALAIEAMNRTLFQMKEAYVEAAEALCSSRQTARTNYLAPEPPLKPQARPDCCCNRCSNCLSEPAEQTSASKLRDGASSGRTVAGSPYFRSLCKHGLAEARDCDSSRTRKTGELRPVHLGSALSAKSNDCGTRYNYGLVGRTAQASLLGRANRLGEIMREDIRTYRQNRP